MEGGTDLDLQVLEAPPTAVAAEAGGGGAKDTSQTETDAGQASAQSGSGPAPGQADQTGGGEGSTARGPEKVRTESRTTTRPRRPAADLWGLLL